MPQSSANGTQGDLSEGVSKPPDDRLPDGALVSYQQISLGMQVPGNYRWILYLDGRWYLGRNSRTYGGQKGPFESALPSTPTRTLPTSVVQEVEGQLRAGDFLSLESEYFDRTLQDGAQVIVTARLDGRVHEVTFDGAYSPLVDYLREFAWRHEAGDGGRP